MILEKECYTEIRIFEDHFFNHIFTLIFFNVNISIDPLWTSMASLPAVDSIHMKGKASQIFAIVPSFYFVIKNGKLVVIVS